MLFQHAFGGVESCWWHCPLDLLPVYMPRLPVATKHIAIQVCSGKVLFEPLLAHVAGLRGFGKQCARPGPDVPLRAPLAELLVALLLVGDRAALHFAASLVSWAAWVLERVAPMTSGSTDPLDIPLLRGKKRLRRIPLAFKEAVVEKASKGVLAKTPSRVMRMVKYFKQFVGPTSRGLGKKWEWASCCKYVASVQRAVAMAGPPSGVFSVCMDGTRMAGRETLWASLWSSQTQASYWLPPQVGA